jgi:hypothetical protein
LIWEIGQRGGRFDVQEVELSFLSACLAEHPRPPCGLSARCGSAGCSSCSSCFLECFRFDPFGQLFLARRSLTDCPPGCRGPSARHQLLADRSRIGHRPSVTRSALLEVWFSFSNHPSVTCEPSACTTRTSARSSRTVHLVLADCPLGALQSC